MKTAAAVLSVVLGVAISALLAQVQAPQETPSKQKITARLARSASPGSAAPYTQIDFNWSYTPNLPSCTDTLAACYDGFVLTNATANQVIAQPSSIGPSALSYAWIPVGGVPYGVLNFSLMAHGYDEEGNVVLSAPATVTVDVKVVSLNGPTGLTGKPE